MYTIKFSPNRRIKTSIDFERNYSVYDAVEILYSLHNRALNRDEKYTVEMTVVENNQDMLMDEIPIGTMEKLNVFTYLENHISQVYKNDKDNQEYELLLTITENLREEYQAEQITSESNDIHHEDDTDLEEEVNKSNSNDEEIDVEAQNMNASDRTNYHSNYIKALFLGIVILFIGYSSYQIINYRNSSEESLEEYLTINSYEKAIIAYPDEMALIERELLLEVIQDLNEGQLNDALETSQIIENEDLTKLVNSTYQAHVNLHIANEDFALANELGKQLNDNKLTKDISNAYSAKIIKLIKEDNLTEADLLSNEINDKTLIGYLDTYKQLDTELKDLNTQLEAAEDDKKEEVTQLVKNKQNEFDQFKEGL